MDRQVKQLTLTRICALAMACLAVALPLIAEQARPSTKKTIVPFRTKTKALLTPRERVLEASPLGMYYYVGDARGQASMLAHSSRMGLLAPQCYWITHEGGIRGALPPHVAETARRASIPIMPLIFNRGFDRETVTALLHNPVAQWRATNEMAKLASSGEFAGFQIDFENVAPEDQTLFTQFIHQAAERLHEDGRLLSVTLVPKFTDNLPAPSPKPTMSQWAAAYDYRSLGDAADFVTLMTYDHFSRLTGAGPIAGYEWVRKALDYAVARIPPEKILLGIPLYGREWIEIGDRTRSRSLTAQTVFALRTQWKPAAEWDERWRSPWFQFRRRRALHTVWYEDRRSWEAKLGLISEYHLRGFAAWRLGFEGPNFWTVPGIAPARATKKVERESGSLRSSKHVAAKQRPASRTSSASAH